MYYFKHQNVLINILLLYCVHSIYIAKIIIQNHSPYRQNLIKSSPQNTGLVDPELIASILVWYRNWNTWNISLSLPKYFSNTNEKHAQSLKAIILPSSISTYKLALLESWQQLSPKSTIFQCQYQIPWRRDACRYKT